MNLQDILVMKKLRVESMKEVDNGAPGGVLFGQTKTII